MGLDRGLPSDPPDWRPLGLAPALLLPSPGAGVFLATDHARPAATGPPHTR
jgi:hypothetical protein